MLIDTISTTSCKLTATSAEELLSRQEVYLELFNSDDFSKDIFRTATPIPGELINIMVRVNLLRAELIISTRQISYTNSITTIFDCLDSVDLEGLTSKALSTINTSKRLEPPETDTEKRYILDKLHADSKNAWRALITAYHSAITIYAINNLAGFGSSTQRLKNLETATSSPSISLLLLSKETIAYEALVDSITLIFHQREEYNRLSLAAAISPDDLQGISAGVLHKFMIWPMVIAGIQASLVKLEDTMVHSISENMQAVGRELGTFGMIDGSYFVKNLRPTRGDEHISSQTWDDLFVGRPIFFM